jgi:hypothetical protein
VIKKPQKTRRLKPAIGLWKIQPQWVVTPRKQTNKQTNFIMKYWHSDWVVLVTTNSSLYTVMSTEIDLFSVSDICSRDTLGILVTKNYSAFVVTRFNKVKDVSGATVPKLTHFNLSSL